MPALSAEISAFTTRCTLPPARKCPSSSLTSRLMPALCPLISGSTMARGSTRRNRMPKSVRNETRTPEKRAVSQSPNGNELEEDDEGDDGDEHQRQHHSRD